MAEQTRQNGRRTGGRGNGEGMAPRLRADGRWEARITLADGRRKAVYGKSAKEARDKMATMLRQQVAGLDLGAERQTVAVFVRRWLDDAAASRLRPKTVRSYRQMIETHIVPAVGDHTLDKLTPAHVTAMLNGMRMRGLSPRVRQYARAILRTALGQALKWGYVTRNAAALTDPPKQEARKVEPMSAEAAKALLAATEQDRLGPLYAVALTTGLRQGELLGLRWSDVDLDMGMLVVRQALQKIGREWVIGPPKSDTSRRTIPLAEATIAALRRQRARQAEERLRAGEVWDSSWGLVYTALDGMPLDGGEVTKKLQRAQAAAGLPRTTFHDLRHGAATLLLAQGVPLATIRDILGHSTITLTANTYAHVVPELRRDAAAAMDRALGA